MSFLRDFVRGAARRVEEPSDEQVVTEDELAEIQAELIAKMDVLRRLADQLDVVIKACDTLQARIDKPESTVH